MYDSKSLPLSKKKIIKKSLPSSIGYFFISLFIGGGVVLVSLADTGNNLSAFLNGLLALLIFDLIFIGLTVLYQYLYFKFYYYDFQVDTAEIKKGVISMATGHVRYSKIQNIFVDQDLLDRIFGLYDVHYETAGEHSGFYSHVDGLNKDNSDKLVAFLKERVLQKETQPPAVPTSTTSTDAEKTTALPLENGLAMINRSAMPLEKRIVPVMIWTRSTGMIVALLYLTFAVLFNEDGEPVMSESLTFLFAVGVPLLSIIGNYIYAKIWYKNYNFSFDQKQGLIEEKVISSNQKYIYYNRIQNINVTQSVLDRFFKLYRVTIETASEGTKKSILAIIGLNKENADKLKDFLINRSSSHQAL